MIIDNLKRTDLKTIGNVQQIKASIDVENLEFISILLSSNLYSNPIRSFLREIVSNAWDSHVEAGNTEHPVIIKVSEDNMISIRDYGTGLSKQDFLNLYCKIGSSTRRESNSYIGCFGLGHLSPLAVSDIVYVTNYYNGTMSEYMMVRDNNTITTNFIRERKANEANGLMVSVKLSDYQVKKVIKEVNYLCYFPNLYVDIKGQGHPINNCKVRKYNSFSVSSLIMSDTEGYYSKKALFALVGNVLYPISMNDLKLYSHPIFTYDTKNALESCHLCLNLSVGDVNVTPNRESIIFTNSTIEVITNKLIEAYNEIMEHITAHNNIDFQDIVKYKKALNGIKKYWHPHSDSIDNCQYTGYELQNNIKFTYKGEYNTDFANAISSISMYSAVVNFKGLIDNNKFYTIKSRISPSKQNQMSYYSKYLAIEDNRNITGYCKQYLMSDSKFHNRAIVPYKTEDEYYSDILSTTSIYGRDTEGYQRACRELAKHLMDNLLIVTVKEIDEYKQKNRATKNRDIDKDKNLYILHKYSWENSIVETVPVDNKPIMDILKFIKHRRCIILEGSSLSSKDIESLKVFQVLGFNIYWCSKTLYSKIFKIILRDKSQYMYSNVWFSFEEAREHLCPYQEKMICASKIVFPCSVGTSFSVYISAVSGIISDKTCFELCKIYVDHIRDRASVLNNYFKDYKYKYPTLQSYEEALSKLIDILTIHSKNYDLCISTEYPTRLNNYLTFKTLMRKRYGINYKRYQTLKKSIHIRKIDAMVQIISQKLR